MTACILGKQFPWPILRDESIKCPNSMCRINGEAYAFIASQVIRLSIYRRIHLRGGPRGQNLISEVTTCYRLQDWRLEWHIHEIGRERLSFPDNKNQLSSLFAFEISNESSSDLYESLFYRQHPKRIGRLRILVFFCCCRFDRAISQHLTLFRHGGRSPFCSMMSVGRSICLRAATPHVFDLLNHRRAPCIWGLSISRRRVSSTSAGDQPCSRHRRYGLNGAEETVHVHLPYNIYDVAQ
ncbi:hypothetical protein BDZ97DRAFT_1226558 [Flammula alnicola]|nr:hypothetical protein BDZ97DRAFT_1226558 [Flammula alnicola]